jgi:hypothetical protein
MKIRRSPGAIIGVVIAVVIAVNLALRELDRFTRSPGGPESSSFATAPEGIAAYAELLRRFDRPVVQLRDELAQAELDPRETLVVLDPGSVLTFDEGVAVRGFVESGGRLVAGGNPTGWLRTILEQVPGWRPSAPESARVVDIPGVDRVRTAGGGSWVNPEGHVLVRAGAEPIVVERRRGAGTVLLVADASLLQNRLLAEADNAALGLALAGERPVAFAESVHGYGAASGLDAIPSRWWLAFGGLCAAALVFALARGRRFGPAELAARELPPARVEFAEALATQLAKARPREEAVLTARRVARGRVTRALGLPPGAADADLRDRADARRFDPEELEAVLADGVGESDLLAVGRALRSAEQKEKLA